MKKRHIRKVIVLSFGALLGLVLMLKTRLSPSPVRAANLVVTDAVDGGANSLRAVIAAAQDGDTITFDTNSIGPAINLILGPIPVTKSITISGPGASNLRISGGSDGPIFDAAVGSKTGASISGLKLTGTTNSRSGGAITNNNACTLRIDNCVISGNTADFGGGIHNQGGVITIDACTITQNTANAGGAISNQGGTVTVNNTTISSNTANSQNGGGITSFGSGGSGSSAFLFVNNSTLTGNSAQGGGSVGGALCNSDSGFAQLVNCTVTSNSCPIAGGGIDTNSSGNTFIISCTVTGNTSNSANVVGAGGVDSLSALPGTVTLYNSIIAENGGLGDINNPKIQGAPTVTSGGHNLIQSPMFGFTPAASDIIGQNPLLLPLADNGGPTQTQALSCGSPALDAGDDQALGLSPFLAGDERGLPRKAGAHVDIGAYELQTQLSPATLPGGTAGVFYSQTFTATGGDAPYSFLVAAGNLPMGLQLAGNVLFGTPTAAGNFTFTIEAQDKTGAALCVTYGLSICANITASISGDQSICPPGPGATVTVAINISGGSPPYNVFVTDGSGASIGTTFSQPNPQMLLLAPSQTTTFTLKSVMDASGCSATSLTGSATITVNQPPSVTTNPQNLTACQGATVSFSAAAVSYPAATVQWQFNAWPGAPYTNIPGATSTTLSFSADPTQNGHNFRAVFSNGCGTAATQAATLIVNTAPRVTTNPQSTIACAGSPATFSAAASGNPAPSIQWQGSTDGGSFFADIPGATASTLTLSPGTSQNGVKFRAVFTNTCGSATSQAATLTVNLAPTVKTNPLNLTVCEGTTISFTAAATGSPAPTVQWQVSTGGGATYSTIPGATASTLSLTADASHNGYNYQAVFTNTCGTATSQAATLTVNTRPVITSNPLSVSAMAGASVSFSAAAAGTPAPYVLWQMSTDGGTTFLTLAPTIGTTMTLTVTPGMSGYQYRAVFTNTCGTATTTAAVLSVFDKCLKDDSTGNFIQFNSLTGDYLLTVCGAGGFAVSGHGIVNLAGNVLTVSDNRPDRRVAISYFTNQLTGSATINLSVAPGVFNTIRIIQRRTNATCGCS